MSAASSSSAVAEGPCATAGCKNAATMQCPTCLKLALRPSYFCSQACFRSSWPVHKLVHTAPKQLGVDPRFAGFTFTGALRPAILSPTRTVPAAIARPDYAAGGIPHSEKAAKKTMKIEQLNADEVEALRAACELGRRALDAGAAAIKPGVTTDEIDRIVHETIVADGGYPSPLNYYGFPKSCCTSINEVICHGIPDSRPLENGDICNLDVTAYLGGFHGDLNATYTVGECSDDARRLIRVTEECLEKAIAMCKPGIFYRDLGHVISKHAHANGFSVVRSYCGHGIHRLFHCAPNVPHYAKNKAVGIMKVGHAFTIEPMINAGSWNDRLWPDEWTSTTVDGKWSAQFEHTMVVTETGVDVLTRAPKSG